MLFIPNKNPNKDNWNTEGDDNSKLRFKPCE